MADTQAAVWLGGQVARHCVDYSTEPACLNTGGRWAVVVEFTGQFHAWRFDDWRPGTPDEWALAWHGPALNDWESSMSRDEYVAAVEQLRDNIARGEVYQANVCRRLSAPMPTAEAADVFGLSALLAAHNPAPFAGCISAPEQDVSIATASPELFLRRQQRELMSSPIKGTGQIAEQMGAKDRAENVMIVDLVRNDLSRVAVPGSVEVPHLLRIEQHPGLFHLVSDVTCQLADGVGWSQILAGTYPPGSVTGAPKSSALRLIDELEPVDRGPYCGAIGWVDATDQTAELAVGIRTFWLSGSDKQRQLNFGTGAGITWGSDPQAEWEETELKAATLIRAAARQWSPGNNGQQR